MSSIKNVNVGGFDLEVKDASARETLNTLNVRVPDLTALPQSIATLQESISGISTKLDALQSVVQESNGDSVYFDILTNGQISAGAFPVGLNVTNPKLIDYKEEAATTKFERTITSEDCDDKPFAYFLLTARGHVKYGNDTDNIFIHVSPSTTGEVIFYFDSSGAQPKADNHALLLCKCSPGDTISDNITANTSTYTSWRITTLYKLA